MDKFLKRENESFNNSNSSGEWLCSKKKPAVQVVKLRSRPGISKAVKKEKRSQPSILASSMKQDSFLKERNGDGEQVRSPNKYKPFDLTAFSNFTGPDASENKENVVLNNDKLAKCLPEKLSDQKLTLSCASNGESALVSSASTSQQKQKSLPKEWRSALRKLCSPSFQTECERAALEVFDRSKEISALKQRGGSVRNTEARVQLMHGHDCECCAPYYDALNLSPGERQRRINQVSRHRTFEPGVRLIPRTPPRYWDVNFPSVEEQKKLGLVIESSSPLFKKKGPHRKVIRKRVSRSS